MLNLVTLSDFFDSLIMELLLLDCARIDAKYELTHARKKKLSSKKL
jgi:hypothetical protein